MNGNANVNANTNTIYEFICISEIKFLSQIFPIAGILPLLVLEEEKTCISNMLINQSMTRTIDIVQLVRKWTFVFMEIPIINNVLSAILDWQAPGWEFFD